MENQIPKTKEECFALLDAMLSEEDKDELSPTFTVKKMFYCLSTI